MEQQSNKRISAEIESQIAHKVEELAKQFKTRKELSHAVCSLLLVEYSILPSANKLLQYMKRGSLTDLNKDVKEFVANLGANARASINAPGVPDELVKISGEFTVKLWEQACQSAQQLFDVERQAVSERANHLQYQLSLVETERDSLSSQVDGFVEQIGILEAQVTKLADELEQAEKLKTAAIDNAARLNDQLIASEQRRLDYKDTVQQTIDALNLNARQAEDNFKEERNRLNQQIDSERLTITRNAATFTQAEDKYKADIATLQDSIQSLQNELLSLKNTAQYEQKNRQTAENALNHQIKNLTSERDRLTTQLDELIKSVKPPTQRGKRASKKTYQI